MSGSEVALHSRAMLQRRFLPPPTFSLSLSTSACFPMSVLANCTFCILSATSTALAYDMPKPSSCCSAM